MIFTDDASILMPSSSKKCTKYFRFWIVKISDQILAFPCVLKRLSFGKCFLTTIGNHEKSEPVESTGFRESQISSFRADLNSNFQKILSWFLYWNEISLIWNLIAYFWIFTTFLLHFWPHPASNKVTDGGSFVSWCPLWINLLETHEFNLDKQISHP